MLMVFSDAGYDVKRHFDDGVVSLEFNIDPTDKSRAVMESREHRAEARSIQELLAPSSVAVIGASREVGQRRATSCSNTSSKAASPARSTPSTRRPSN